MTLLVAGNAAMLDLILQADGRPASAEVGVLKPSPGASGQWLPGGAAFTIALAARRHGAAVAVWHPLPTNADDVELALRRAGIDLSRAPRIAVEAGRCVLVDLGEGRTAWSTASPEIETRDFTAVLAGVSHLVIASRWGDWTDALVQAAAERGIPASLVGEPAPSATKHRWAHVVLEETQLSRMGPIEAQAIVATRGAQGVRLIVGDREVSIPAAPADVVDATGAGDTFGGAFIACRLRGMSFENAARAAAVSAARACEAWGAWAGASGPSTPHPPASRQERARGALAGTACGDAFGMPNSFLPNPPWRLAMEAGPPDSPYHAGYPAGRITDDTEQALALTDALEDGFTAEAVALRLNAWFVSVGGANSLAVGPSTRRAMLAYQANEPVSKIGRTGVTNGAAMRIAPIGVFAGLQSLDLEALLDLVEAACLPTHHTGPAIAGAAAIAAAVAAGVRGEAWEAVMAEAVAAARTGAGRGAWTYSASVADRILHARRLVAGAPSDQALVRLISDVVGAGEPTTESVPAALAIADFVGGDPARAIEIAGNLRGDTDTVAAMAGAVCGAYAGVSALPSAWIETVERVNNLDIAAWSERLVRCANGRVIPAARGI